ncbi:MAG: hypothetical protein EOP82_07120 [Variovorax sp.]|nr:MAG: hypothetical protein EOP82_07120 [Variovorax sp.]
MTTVTTTVLAASLALGSVSAIAQTAAPPASGSTGPTAPNPQDPSVSSKDAKPLGDHPALGKDEKSKGTAKGTAAMAPSPRAKIQWQRTTRPSIRQQTASKHQTPNSGATSQPFRPKK